MHPEEIYENSIKLLGGKFIAGPNDLFLTEKDLHFHFFHYCLDADSFEFQSRLLIHTEYPMPFKVKKGSPNKIVDDKEDAMRPHIDSVLFNKNFIQWLSIYGGSKKNIDNCLRGLGNAVFTDYIKEFRERYQNFHESSGECVLSHCIEFKFIRSGYEGTSEPMKNIQYDLEKLRWLGKNNVSLRIPFSGKCTLLIFVGQRGVEGFLEKLDKTTGENQDLFGSFKNEVERSPDANRCVIRYDLDSD
jgi:hypothetical protein